MKTSLRLMLAGVAALALPVSTAVAEGGSGKSGFGKGRHGLVHPGICKRDHSSEETQRWCDSIVGLRGRDLYKAIVLENLRRTNRPPVADVRLGQLGTGLLGRVDLDGSGSFDEDGFVARYNFQLIDDDTDLPLGGGASTPNPAATMQVDGGLPLNVRALVTVSDDEGATNSAELSFTTDPSAQTFCSPAGASFQCMLNAGGGVRCQVTPGVNELNTLDLLSAAQACDPTIGEDTDLVLAATGGAGGTGQSVGFTHGGSRGFGGEAIMGTTVADLDAAYGFGAAYCYGIGQGAPNHGSGGASTLLRTCDNASQTETTGVLLIAGGGGGGGDATGFNDGGNGAFGGIAISTTSGACPPSCAAGPTTN
jgi:hypothetical protein